MLGPVRGETQKEYSRNFKSTATSEPLAQRCFKLPETYPGNRPSAGARQSCPISTLTDKVILFIPPIAFLVIHISFKSFPPEVQHLSLDSSLDLEHEQFLPLGTGNSGIIKEYFPILTPC